MSAQVGDKQAWAIELKVNRAAPFLLLQLQSLSALPAKAFALGAVHPTASPGAPVALC